jgi:hypothetical protein
VLSLWSRSRTSPPPGRASGRHDFKLAEAAPTHLPPEVLRARLSLFAVGESGHVRCRQLLPSDHRHDPRLLRPRRSGPRRPAAIRHPIGVMPRPAFPGCLAEDATS